MNTAGRMLLCFALAVAAPLARAQVVPDGMAVEPLVTGLSAPTGFDFLPDGRVLFVEQFTARVRVFREGAGVQATPVISVAGVSSGGERGLLGIAVDPRFPASPYLYLYYDVASPQSIRISRYTLAGDLAGTGGDLTADPATRYDVLTGIPDAASNHNGGTLRFGLDNLLYSGLGDDASSCSAQTPGLRGSLLRLNVLGLPPGAGHAFFAQIAPADNPFAASTDSAARLVAAYGLRNPFRVQLDTGSGVLVIGDVGATVREEVDLLAPPGSGPLAGAPLGTNFGWPYREGTIVNPGGATCGTAPPGLVPPIWDFDRTSETNAAIIAAGVYRSHAGQTRALPADHVGDVFASDYYSGVLYRLKLTGGTWAIAPPIAGQPSATHWGEGFSEISDWRVGPDGAFWYCRQSTNFVANTGSLGRVAGPGTVSVPPPARDARFAIRSLVSPAVGGARFAVAAPVAVTVRIVDAAGRAVRELAVGAPGGAASERTLVWDGRNVAGDAVTPGMYVAVLAAGSHVRATRVVLLR